MKVHVDPFKVFAARSAGTLALGAAFLAAASLPARADVRAPFQPIGWGVATPFSMDRTFVTDLLQEARGQLALARAAQARVPEGPALDDARQAEATWETLRARLASLAYAEGAPVRGSLDAGQRAALLRLERMSPFEAQDAYVGDVRRGDDLALTRMRAERGMGDPRIARFISFARPLVVDLRQLAG